MGKVYPTAEVAAGLIPEKGAHEAAGQYILHELFEPVIPDPAEKLVLFEPDGNGVDSAMVYGSTAYGTAGVRSDLDVLVFFRPSQALTALAAISRVLQTAKNKYRVPVEQNILPVGAVYDDREHGLDPLFAGHLLEIHDTYNGRWCRNNPTDGLARIAAQADNPASVLSLAHAYSSGRRNYFAKGLTENNTAEVDCGIFQRALELPSAIGRKAVAALMETDAEPLDLSSRPRMQDRARTALMTHMTVYDETMLAKHDQLYGLDLEYSELLAQTIDGSSSIETHEAWLQGNFVPACQMAYTLSQAWVDILHARRQVVQPQLVVAGSFDGGEQSPAFDPSLVPAPDVYSATSYA